MTCLPLGPKTARALFGALLLSLALLSATGCGGPRITRLTDQKYKPLARDAKVDVYVGDLKTTSTQIAVIESDAYSYIDDLSKRKQLEQLKAKARKLGANTVQDVKILAKHVQGYTLDERTPFPAWQQGKYDLYFMRGTAVRVPVAEADTMEDAKPQSGWVVERYAPPQKLDAALSGIPAPTVHQEAPTAAPSQAAPPQAAQPQAAQPQNRPAETELPPPPEPDPESAENK